MRHNVKGGGATLSNSKQSSADPDSGRNTRTNASQMAADAMNMSPSKRRSSVSSERLYHFDNRNLIENLKKLYVQKPTADELLKE